MDKKRLVKVLGFAAMFDGCLVRNDYRADRPNKAVNASLKFDQTEDHADFVEYVGGFAEELSPIRRYREERVYPRENLVGFMTRRLPFYSTMRDRMYVGSYKSVDPHLLKLLDAEALAIMFMADGNGRMLRGMREFTISLARLSYGDAMLVKKAMQEKLDLCWNIRRSGSGGKYNQIYLMRSSIERFQGMIEPWILPSFEYKLARTPASSKEDGDIV